MNWDDLQYEKTAYKQAGWDCYGQSKLAQILSTVELAKRLEGTGVTAVSLNPGLVVTDIWRTRQEATFKRKVLLWMSIPLVKLFGKNAADGAKTTIYCATSDDVPNHNGKYFE
jgi:retinol dehydrogenase-12